MKLTLELKFPDDITDTDAGPGFDADFEINRVLRDLAHTVDMHGVHALNNRGCFDSEGTLLGTARLDDGMPTLQAYTVFVRRADNLGTTWIGVVQAPSWNAAGEAGLEQCKAEWGDVGDPTVVGVAEDDVQILYWEDLE